ncbi:N-acetyltransferase family protein [Lichenicoccus sp.]|uniref:GNAT family N-acetyltransferase n=1 Tax=Lichenicoccus sp. TaxID=2781899 RepID=UPI003D1087F9
MIRAADQRDLPAILEITNDAILSGTALWTITPQTLADRHAWMMGRREAGFPVLVAEQDGAVRGFGSYGAFRPHDGYARTVEHSLYVHAQARRAGIGSALLAALVARAQEAGKHVMIGGIEAENHASIALHERAGFVRAAVLPQVGRKFERWLDLLFMYRML